MATPTYSTTPEQRKVITDYAELVSVAYRETVLWTDNPDVAALVAQSVAQMLIQPTIMDYAQMLAAKPRIQMAPKLIAN